MLLTVTSLVLSLSAPTVPLASGTNTHFAHTLETTATAEKIWRVWTDVARWPEWGAGLVAAELQGPFAAGTTGVRKPDKGPTATFTLVAVEAGHSYTLRTGCRLARCK